MKLENFEELYLDDFVQYGDEILAIYGSDNTRLFQSMQYSLSNGGKRMRPLLTMALAEVFGGEVREAFDAALAVELIHTYSLIHDDLPAMDDDDLRRGLPTNHKQFDEATAILAGDSLLTMAFEIIVNAAHYDDLEKVALVKSLTKNAGARGMVLGQMLDIEGEEATYTVEELKHVHANKTGAILDYCFDAAKIIAKPAPAKVDILDDFVKDFGVAYQIHNDLKDVMWDQERTGKELGKDEANDKNTYPSLLGKQGALDELNKYKASMNHHLTRLQDLYEDADVELLAGFLTYLEL